MDLRAVTVGIRAQVGDNLGFAGDYSLKIECIVLQNEFERINRYDRVFVSEYKLF